MPYKRGEVIDINLNPVKGSETGKTRPCVIVTNNVYNAKLPVLQVVPLTEWSEKKGRILSNVTIEPDERNNLLKKSVADCLQCRPVDIRARLVKRRGVLDAKSLEKIDQGLKVVFGIA